MHYLTEYIVYLHLKKQIIQIYTINIINKIMEL